MKTNAKFLLLAAAFAATAGSALAQQFVVRGEAGLAGANKGPFNEAGGVCTVYFGRTLDAANQNELSVSVGAVFWGESDVDRGHSSTPGNTTLWLDNQKLEIPSGNSQFSFRDSTMTIDNGSSFHTDYHPSLSVVPIMANYRFNIGRDDAPVRFFVGAGAGVAGLEMETRLWRRFAYDDSWWGWSRHDSDNQWTFTWNATAGVTLRINRRMAVDLSYAFQQVGGATFHMRGVSFKLDDMNVNMGRAAFVWKF